MCMHVKPFGIMKSPDTLVDLITEIASVFSGSPPLVAHVQQGDSEMLNLHLISNLKVYLHASILM